MKNKVYYIILFLFFKIFLFGQKKYVSFNAGITINKTNINENTNDFFHKFQPKEGEVTTLEPGLFGEINYGRRYERNAFELGLSILETTIKVAATDANGLIIHGDKYQWLNIPFRYYRTLFATERVQLKIGAEVNILSRSYTNSSKWTTCFALNGVMSSCSTVESKNYQPISIGIGPVSSIELKIFKNIYLNIWYYQIWRPGRGYDHTIVSQELNPNTGAVLQEYTGLFHPRLSTANLGIGLIFYKNKGKEKIKKTKKNKKKKQFIYKQRLNF